MNTDLAQIICLRPAEERDVEAIGELAELDSRRRPDGHVLLALVDGRVVAAVSVRDGHTVANPFVPTAEAVALLRLHTTGSARAAA